MIRQPRILAGTALGLLMASAPLGAAPLPHFPFANTASKAGHMPAIQVQSDCLEGETSEECAARQQQPAEEESAPAQTEQAPDETAPAEAAQPDAPAVEEPVQEEAAPAPAEQAPSEAAPAEAAQPEAPAVEQPVQEAVPEKKRKARPVEEAAPAPAEQTPSEAAPAQAAQPEEPAAEQPLQEAAPEKKPRKARPVEEAAPAPAEQAPTEAAPAQAAQPEAPADEQPVQAGEAPADPDEAPLLDSQKEEPRKGGRKNQRAEKPAAEPVDQGPPPASDAAAAEAAQPEKIEAATAEEGKRVRPDEEKRRRRERPEGTDVLREIGNRLIIELGNQVIVESDDRPRMTRGARDVYYEDLPRGRTRETIVRANGVRIVTVRNRYGDVIRRSRITPDGREYVLVYVDEDNYDRVRDWRDPGDDLPPMRLNIPRRQYILDAEDAQDPDDYYDFLEQPPVEKVQRLYSIDEVKRSARVRDIARRVDLDTLTFEFGSATIPESEISKLEGVAIAMERLLEKNPAETFLIEGHTDAVGSETANLALSDRRAEAVAEALTNVFEIPPENLAPQGYGERYLKVKTEEPERQNRRVAIRRITALVAPVASAN